MRTTPFARWLRIVQRATFDPLLRRFEGGEGMLILVNVSLSFVSGHTPARKLFNLGLSTGLMSLMYSVNDLIDAERDLQNPRKDASLASLFVEHRAMLKSVLLTLHGVAVVAASCVDLRLGLVSGTLLLTNAAYSLLAKGVAVLDVLVVGLWGGLFALLTGPIPARAALAVGAMTAISHVFQAMGDRTPDIRAGLRTSASSPVTTYAMLAASSVALKIALGPLVPGPLSWVAVAPLVLGLTVKRSQIAWLLSKLAFGVVWLKVIDGLR